MSVDRIKLATDNLERALLRLEKALSQPLDNPLAIDATIQRFEFTIELVWKALKRFLEHEGIEVTTPRSILQQAYQLGWLQNEEAWLQMLRDRNETSHTYDEAKARQIYERIRNNAPEIRRAHQVLQQRLAGLLAEQSRSGG